MHRTTRRTVLKALSGAAALAATGTALATAKVAPDAKCALVLVDVRDGFAADATLPVIGKLAAGFRTVVLTQDWDTPGHACFTKTCQSRRPFEAARRDRDAERSGPRRGRHSAFEDAGHATGLTGYLKARDIDTLFVAGLAGDAGVAWAAMDARTAGFGVYVIEDAHRGIDPNGALSAAWRSMMASGVKRIRSTDLLVAFAEGLRRAGRNPTREGFSAAIAGLGKFDLGGFRAEYGPANHSGSNFVELAMYNADGSLIR